MTEPTRTITYGETTLTRTSRGGERRRLRPRGVSDDWDAAKDGLVRVRRKVAEGVADEGPV